MTTAFGVNGSPKASCFFKMKKIQNCLNSWAAYLSNKFNADYRLMAYSGKGVVQNNAGVPGLKMPTLFTRITTNSKPYSYKYQDGVLPDAIFFFIGANDYSHVINPSPSNFVRGYKDMLQLALK